MGLFDSDADKAFDARFDDNSYVSGVNGVNVTSFSGFKKYVKGDFVGIGFDGVRQLDTDIDALITKVQGTVSGFGTDALIEKGLKGKALDDATAYVEAIKAVLNAYIESMREIKAVAQAGITVMADTDAQSENNIATSIETEANDAANQIDVDSLGY